MNGVDEGRVIFPFSIWKFRLLEKAAHEVHADYFQDFVGYSVLTTDSSRLAAKYNEFYAAVVQKNREAHLKSKLEKPMEVLA